MKSVEQGKKIVIAFIIVLLIANVISSISRGVYGQADEIGANTFYGLVRFALIGSILYYLYAGNKVAKWLTVALTLISGIMGLLAVLLAFTNGVDVIDIMNMALVIGYIIIGIVLIVSRPVNDYLRFQRGEYKEESNSINPEMPLV